MYTLTHYAYCGMRTPLLTKEDRAERDDARSAAAEHIRAMRALGFHVVTLSRGADWEVLEPEDCAIVPDDCGVLSLRATTVTSESTID